MYDDNDCGSGILDWKPLDVKEGLTELDLLHRNDAESVLVRKNCSFRSVCHYARDEDLKKPRNFRGYDHKGGLEAFLHLADEQVRWNPPKSIKALPLGVQFICGFSLIYIG